MRKGGEGQWGREIRRRNVGGGGEEVATGQMLKAGVHLKAVFWLGIMFLMQISRLRFKQSRICSLITHIYVLRRFVNFLVIFRFIWR